MKKKLSILIALVMAISLCLVPAVASANPGTPTIDGVIEVDEWGSPDFVCTQNDPGSVDYNLYIENDADNLYIAAEYVSGDFTVNQGLGLANALNIYIDSNNNGDVVDAPDNEDIGIILSDDDMLMIPYIPPTNDWDWQATGSFKAAGGDYASDGDYTTGNGIVEVKIPFSLLGGVGPGSTIGLLFQAFGYDCWPVMPNVHPNWPETYTEVTIPANTEVGLTGEVETITAINVTPTSIAFGTLYPGKNSTEETITVENIGTVPIDVNASVSPPLTLFDNLTLDGDSLVSWQMQNLAMEANLSVVAQVVVPLDYTSKGEETATLAFIATRVQ